MKPETLLLDGSSRKLRQGALLKVHPVNNGDPSRSWQRKASGIKQVCQARP